MNIFQNKTVMPTNGGRNTGAALSLHSSRQPHTQTVKRACLGAWQGEKHLTLASRVVCKSTFASLLDTENHLT